MTTIFVIQNTNEAVDLVDKVKEVFKRKYWRI